MDAGNFDSLPPPENEMGPPSYIPHRESSRAEKRATLRSKMSDYTTTNLSESEAETETTVEKQEDDLSRPVIHVTLRVRLHNFIPIFF